MLVQEKSLIVVIDVQGNLAKVVAQAGDANKNVQNLIRGGQALDLPIILTAQAPEKIGHTTDEVLSLLPGSFEYPRTSFSVWADEACRRAVEKTGRTQVLLCGFESHICLYQSAIELLLAGYDVWIVADAVSSRSLENKQIALTELRAEGAHLTSVEMALFSLMEDARHPAFKSISKMIR